MKKGIRISVVALSAVIIASCATDRIHRVSKEDLACKTPETKYDYGRNLPIREIKTNNRKYSRYVHRASWNNIHTRSASKNLTRVDKDPVTIVAGQGIIKADNTPAFPGIDRQTIDRQMIIWSASEENKDQLEKLRGPAAASLISAEIIAILPLETSPTPEIITYNPFSASGQEYMESSLPKSYPGQADVSVHATENPEQSQNKPFGNSEAFVFIMALLVGLIPFAAIKAYPNLAANVSFWAATNPWKTRLMFAGTNTAMIAGGLMLGEHLADSGIHLSGLSRYLLMGTFFASSLLYPVRNASSHILKHSYSKQKAFDLAVAISGFMLMVNAGNDPAVRATLTNMVSLNNRDHQYENTLNGNHQAPQKLIFYEPVEKIQDEQKTAEEEKQIRNKKIGSTAAVSFLALLAAFVVAVGACGLSCNGMAGLAALTGIGGGGLVIGLTIWAIRRIWHPRVVKEIKPKEDAAPVMAKGTFRI